MSQLYANKRLRKTLIKGSDVRSQVRSGRSTPNLSTLYRRPPWRPVQNFMQFAASWRYPKKIPLTLHSFYISRTTSPNQTKFGSILPHGPLMTPHKFGAVRPNGGAVIEAQMPHSFQWEFQPKHILPHNYGKIHRTFIHLMSTCLGDWGESRDVSHAHSAYIFIAQYRKNWQAGWNHLLRSRKSDRHQTLHRPSLDRAKESL